MNFLMTAIVALFFSSQALACTKSETEAQSKLIRIFQLAGNPVDWISVKTITDSETKQKTIQTNRTFPVTVEATRRLNSSRIKYKRDVYDLSNATVCFQGEKILVSHPKGELIVSRRGRGLTDSEISLRQNGGVLNLRLRPAKLLKGRSTIVL